MIYINPDTKELDIGDDCTFLWYDCPLDDLLIKYYPIISHLYFKNNQYYMVYALRFNINNTYKYIISLIPIDINLLK